MDKRHIANSIRKRLREADARVALDRNTSNIMQSSMLFIRDMQELADRIDREEDEVSK
jgi:hypothetical protein